MSRTLDNRTLNRDIAHIMVPSVLESMLQLAAGMICTAMVGRLLADDIAAQGISNRIYHICFAIYRGLRIGLTVVAARYIGEHAYDKYRRSIEQAYLTGIGAALLMAVAVAFFSGTFSKLLTNDPRLLQASVEYSRINAWAIPFMAISTFNSAAFNGQGDTKTPMYIALILNVVNIIVGYICIFGINGFGGLGLNGAAIATVLSQAAGALVGLWLLYRPGGALTPYAHGKPFFSLDKDQLRSIYATGVPAAMENVFWQFSAVAMSRVILDYGTSHYAGYQLGLQAEMITEMPADGFIIASTTLSSRAIGEKNGNLMRGYYRQLIRIGTIAGIGASLLLMALSAPLLYLLTDKVDLQKIGTLYAFMMGFAQAPQVMTKVYNGIIRAAGYIRVPMYFSFIGIWLLRVPFSMLACWSWGMPIIAIWIIIVIDQTSRLLMSAGYAKWKDIRNIVERNMGNTAANTVA